MSNNQRFDQAAGLRCLLGGKTTQQTAFVSSLTAQQRKSLFFDFSSLLIEKSFNAHVFDINQAVEASDDFKNKTHLLDTATDAHFSHQESIIMLDMHLDNISDIIINILSEGDIVLVTNPETDAVKSTYLKLKTLHKHLNHHNFKLLIVDANFEQAHLIQQNLVRTCRQFLGLNLMPMGYIESDAGSLDGYTSKATRASFPPDSLTAQAFKHVFEQRLTANTDSNLSRAPSYV
jgi:MinD-like ATPase involved in chromosome partitioning or flagellar assembly